VLSGLENSPVSFSQPPPLSQNGVLPSAPNPHADLMSGKKKQLSMNQQFKIQDQIDKLQKKIDNHQKEIDKARAEQEMLRL